MSLLHLIAAILAVVYFDAASWLGDGSKRSLGFFLGFFLRFFFFFFLGSGSVCGNLFDIFLAVALFLCDVKEMAFKKMGASFILV